MQKGQFIRDYRRNCWELLAQINKFLSMRRQYDALGYSSSLVQGDFTDDNAEVLVADFTTAVASLEAITTLLETGHETNLYKVAKND